MMPIFDPKDLALWGRAVWNQEPKNRIEGFSIDTRNLGQGQMFVALKDKRDGHEFLDIAESDGATGALVAKCNHNLSLPQLLADNTLDSLQNIAAEYRKIFTGEIVGITGSCGKTSTKDILGLLLGNEDTYLTEGNFNNHLGVPLSLLGIDSKIHRFAVIEAGINQVGEMQNLAEMILPNLVVITNIGSSHLEGLGSEEGVAAEKSKLFSRHSSLKKVIFPSECLRFKEFSEFYASAPESCIVLRCGSPDKHKKSSDAFYEFRTETNTTGNSFSLRLWRDGFPVMNFLLPPISSGMGSNMALSLLAAMELGISPEHLFERLPQYSPSALRGRTLRGRGCTYFVDCYNANPTSMKDSIQFFSQQYRERPKLFVLGGMEELGTSQEKLHFDLGSEILLEKDDLVLLIGEKAKWIGDGILNEGCYDGQVLALSKGSEAVSIIEDFDGAVFFKGSRALSLEKLIPEWAVEEILG